MIDVSLDAFGEDGLEGFVELLFDFSFVVGDGFLPPVEGSLSGHDDTEAAGESALGVEGDVADAQGFVLGIGLGSGSNGPDALSGLRKAAGAGVPPVDGLEGAHLFAGIELDILAAGTEKDEGVVELA